MFEVLETSVLPGLTTGGESSDIPGGNVPPRGRVLNKHTTHKRQQRSAGGSPDRDRPGVKATRRPHKRCAEEKFAYNKPLWELAQRVLRYGHTAWSIPMEPQNPPDLQVEGWLKTLGVESLCQWDVLVFLCRHLSCLVSGEDIARLLGYPTAEVVTALDGLESLGLVERSRVDRGVRLYQFTAPPDSPRGDALGRLLTVAESRVGRLLLAQKLRRCALPHQNDGPSRGQRGEGSASWRIAI